MPAPRAAARRGREPDAALPRRSVPRCTAAPSTPRTRPWPKRCAAWRPRCFLRWRSELRPQGFAPACPRCRIPERHPHGDHALGLFLAW
ncbi:MAG: hypothetical protein MZV49_11860 [Rhodopseudomonas palustris]|nr:hypothetical protein [Rhodopseudomonas palustris]